MQCLNSSQGSLPAWGRVNTTALSGGKKDKKLNCPLAGMICPEKIPRPTRNLFYLKGQSGVLVERPGIFQLSSQRNKMESYQT